MAMSILTPETVLLVCEELCYHDIQALMLTSESNMNLIKSHEQSIAKARIRRLIQEPQFRPLDRPVISSLDANRTVQGPANFEAVKELERRETMFTALLEDAAQQLEGQEAKLVQRLMSQFMTERLLLAVERNSLIRFMERFGETLQLMDRIMDCAATIRHEFALDPTLPYPGFDKAGLDRVVHRARQNLIAALSPLDLAFLLLVTRIFIKTVGTAPDDCELCHNGPLKEEMLLQSGTMGVYVHLNEDKYTVAFTFGIIKLALDGFGLLKLAMDETIKVMGWRTGPKSQAPNWSPNGTLEPLGYAVRRTFAEKMGSLPEEHLEALANAEEDKVLETGESLKATPAFWLIGRWLLTQDSALEERPPIPQESWKELFPWAMTQEPVSRSSGEEDSDDSDD
jgi:hypothetical protein